MTKTNHHTIFISIHGRAFEKSFPTSEFINWMNAWVGVHGKDWDIWDRYNDDGSDSIGRDIWVYEDMHALMTKLVWGGM